MEPLAVLVYRLDGKCGLIQLVYVVCMSGIVYCVLNGSIENEMKQKWPITFFQNTGARQQTFFEGCLISAVVSLTGLVLVVVGVTG